MKSRAEYESRRTPFLVDMIMAALSESDIDVLNRLAAAASTRRFGAYMDGSVPKSYKCGACGVTGVKLWRGHGGGPVRTSHGDRDLACALCLRDRDGKPSVVDDDGRAACRIIGNRKTDQVCDAFPAVPTEDAATFWGYSSAPDSAVGWWKALPTYRSGRGPVK